MKPKTLLACIPAVFLLASLVQVPLAASAAETLINFDDVADGTLINTYYAGVTFTNPIGGNIVARSGSGSAPSSPNVVCITNGGVLPFFDSPFGAVDARFATPMRVVKIDARPVSQLADHLDPTAARPYFQAFDASSAVPLATVYYAGALPQGCCWEVGATETLTYTSTSANIARVRFSSQQPVSGVHTYGLFDNLRFDDGYYTLTVNIVGGGTVLTSPLGPYFYGSTPSLTASPFVDWVFAGWSGDINTTLNPVLPIMDANKTITATFVATPQAGPNFVVTTTDDHDDGVAGLSDCTLREAINAANANADASTITFAPNVTGVIALQLGQMTITQNLNILGPGATVLAVSGNNSSRVFNAFGGTILISDLTITNGRVNGFTGSPGSTPGGTGGPGGGALGGGIFCQTTLTVSNCWITGNSAIGGSGGAGGSDDFFNQGGNGGPGGVAQGGGVYNAAGTMTLVRCTVSGNTSTGGTGGGGASAYAYFYGDPGNGGPGAAGTGGGILNGSGTLVLDNCTVAGNTTSGGAGGIGGNSQPDADGGAGGAGGNGTGGGLENLNSLRLDNCTISLNNVNGGAGGLGGFGAGAGANGAMGASGSALGGGLRSPTANVIQNSLVAGNSSSTAPDCSGDFTSLGYNLIGVADGAFGFTVKTDQTGTTGTPLLARLGPLQFYGGTVPTMQLLPGSPAIDKGKSAMPTDARGRLRPYDFPTFVNASGGDGSDIGAYELNPPVLSIARSGSGVVLSWSSDEVGFALQSAPQVASPTIWTIVPGQPTIVGSQNTVTINNPAGQRFYRLIEVGIATIPGLFNTGVGANGALLTSGAVDPHWSLFQSADGAFPGPNAIVLNDTGFPIPPWLANGPVSKWLAPQASQAVGNQPGDYKYRITFDLTGLEPSSAVINGHWTSDNTGPQVLLNGAPTGVISDGNFTALGNAFTINTGFIAGVNTLDFVVNNGAPGANPTGVRVELSGIANRQPSP